MIITRSLGFFVETAIYFYKKARLLIVSIYYVEHLLILQTKTRLNLKEPCF